MGQYVDVVAKPGVAEQINEAWRQAGHPDHLVFTRPIIEHELEAIQKSDDLAHQRWINTVEKWNNAFSICAEGRGQVFIPSELTDAERDELVRQVTFVRAHRFLFEEITGLQDAVDGLGMDFQESKIINGRPVVDDALSLSEFHALWLAGEPATEADLAHAALFQGQFREGEPGHARMDELVWRVVDAYPISRLDAPDAEWFRNEQDMAAEDGREGQYDDMLDQPITTPLVIYEDGARGYIWDGNHRAAAAALTGQQHVPAMLARKARDLQSDIYLAAKAEGRDSFWEGWTAFHAAPSWEAWECLRSCYAPNGLRVLSQEWLEQAGAVGREMTVWQLLEREAERLDGQSHGVFGRYRDGYFPEPELVNWTVRRHLQQHLKPRAAGGVPSEVVHLDAGLEP